MSPVKKELKALMSATQKALCKQLGTMINASEQLHKACLRSYSCSGGGVPSEHGPRELVNMRERRHSPRDNGKDVA